MVSILDSTKKLLGIELDDTSFDAEIVLDINSVFTILNQLGVGPTAGFFISDRNATWPEFIGDRTDIELIKTYTYLKVRLMFDLPTNSFLVSSIEKQCSEMEWRLNIQVDTEGTSSDDACCDNEHIGFY